MSDYDDRLGRVQHCPECDKLAEYPDAVEKWSCPFCGHTDDPCEFYPPPPLAEAVGPDRFNPFGGGSPDRSERVRITHCPPPKHRRTNDE
jgi:hypothetical protein